MLRKGEVTGQTELWCHRQVEHRVLQTVLILSLAILVDSSRVTQLPVIILIVGQSLGQVRLLFNVKVTVGKTSHTIAVGAHERALDISQETRSGGCTFVIAGRGTVVTDATGDVTKRSIESDRETLTKRDVCVESDIQTSHIIVLQCALLINVTYREVVVSHSVTAFYIDTIVLGHGRVVYKVLPIGILVVLSVIIVVWVLFQELERTVAGVGCLQHFRGIASVLFCIHYRKELRLENHAGRNVSRDTGSHRLAAVCLNKDHAVSTLGTIQGCSVTHDGHFFNIGRVNRRQNVVEESFM